MNRDGSLRFRSGTIHEENGNISTLYVSDSVESRSRIDAFMKEASEKAKEQLVAVTEGGIGIYISDGNTSCGPLTSFAFETPNGEPLAATVTLYAPSMEIVAASVDPADGKKLSSALEKAVSLTGSFNIEQNHINHIGGLSSVAAGPKSLDLLAAASMEVDKAMAGEPQTLEEYEAFAKESNEILAAVSAKAGALGIGAMKLDEPQLTGDNACV